MFKHWVLLSLLWGRLFTKPWTATRATHFFHDHELNFVRFFRLALYGFDEGVPFVEAQSDSDLPADAHLQPGQFSPDLLATPPAGVSGMPLGVPVLSVKVGRLTGKFSAVLLGVDICARLEYTRNVGATCGGMTGPEGSPVFLMILRLAAGSAAHCSPQCLIRASACNLETSKPYNACLPKLVNDLIICVQIDVKTS
jgi:hypothetical protein